MPSTVAQRPSRSSSLFEDLLGVTRILAQLTSSATSIVNVPIASQVASIVLTLLDITKGVVDNINVRARLASETASYLSMLQHFLDDQAFLDDTSQELMVHLHTFCRSLLEIGGSLCVLEKKNFVKRFFAKDRITTSLLEYEKAMETLVKQLQLRIGFESLSKHNTAITRYDNTEVYVSNDVHALFANIRLAEIIGNGRPVIVKKVDNKLERNKEAQKWRKLWHPNIPHMMGMSKDKSLEHFILFHDNISRRSPYPGVVYSLAGHLIELSKDQEAEKILDILVVYFGDVVSAIRHVQNRLGLSENDTCGLANGANFYICPNDKRIVVAPPLHISASSRSGLFNNLVSVLFPNNGTNLCLMRHYFRSLDNFSTHSSFIPDLSDEVLEKWAMIDGGKALLEVKDGVFLRPTRYIMPDTHRTWVCNTLDIKAGDFGVLYYSQSAIPAFRLLVNPITANNALFSREVLHVLEDRNDVELPKVCEQPIRWKLDGLPENSNFIHEHLEELTYPNVYRSKRFLQLSTPMDCSEQQIVFVVHVKLRHSYGYLKEEKPPADLHAELHNTDTDELRFFHSPSCISLSSRDLPLGSRVSDSIHDYDRSQIRIKYVTVPTRLKGNIANQISTIETQDREKSKAFKHKEYESILQHSPKEACGSGHHFQEWP